MIIQIILTLCFVTMAVYGWAQMSSVRLISMNLMLLSMIATFLVWNPDLTTTLAHALGVGRGADLMMYFFFVFVISQLVMLHVRLRSQMVLLTQLARRMALDEAQVHEHRPESRH